LHAARHVDVDARDLEHELAARLTRLVHAILTTFLLRQVRSGSVGAERASRSTFFLATTAELERGRAQRIEPLALSELAARLGIFAGVHELLALVRKARSILRRGRRCPYEHARYQRSRR
jgi:hypothetical protein